MASSRDALIQAMANASTGPASEWFRSHLAQCGFDGCDKPVSYSGLCSGHAEQRRRGKTLTPLRTPQKVCSVDGCDQPHASKGFCRRHYDRDRRGLPLEPEPREEDLNTPLEPPDWMRRPTLAAVLSSLARGRDVVTTARRTHASIQAVEAVRSKYGPGVMDLIAASQAHRPRMDSAA